MGIFSALRRSRSGSFRGGDGSSRRGRRFGSGRSGQEEPSGKGDSSTHSALFDLELSSRGRGGAGDLLARLNGSVHDEGSAHGGAAGGDPSVRLPSGLLQRIIYLGRPVMEFELDLLQDVRALRATCQVHPDGQLDLECLVDQLHDLGYACYLKHNNPADPGHRHNIQPSCLEKLRHEFIVVAGRADGSLSHWCLVDPRFREQFAIAQPTPTYDRLLKAAPVEFVGTPLRLQALVESLCSEMAEAFLSQGLMLPPWRKFHALLSKWFDPEEMPVSAAPPPPPAHAPPLPPPPALLQLQAAAGPPLTPFEAAQAQPALPVGVGLHLQQPALAAARPAPSLLQQQAAAALAERQSSGGGSQDFYEALEMHKQSMRLQQQAAAGGAQQWQLPTQPPLPPSHQQQEQQEQQQAQQLWQQHPQQGAAPAALSTENLQQLDASYAGPAGALGASSSGGRQPGERSNKPRRRRTPPAGLALASGAHHAIQAALWDEEEGDLEVAALALSGHSGAHVAQAQLHGSGSWSGLSTILETRSNTSSPAAAALLMAAGNAQQLGTSCASRRSTGSALAAVALASAGAGTGAALALPHRSPGRTDQQYAAVSAAGSDATARQVAAALAPLPSPGASLVGFAAPPLGRASLAKSLAKSSAAPSSAQPPSTASSGSSSSPLAPANAPLPHAAASEPYEAAAAAGEGSGRGRRKVVSLLAKGLKSMGQKQTWAGLLPGVNTVRRVGPNGPAQHQRNWSWRGGSEDGSSRRGRKAAQAAQAAAAAAQQPPAQQLPPRHP
ncbi:hypothetical protein ABPG75_004365 [Micractinium tetrahymenae]